MKKRMTWKTATLLLIIMISTLFTACGKTVTEQGGKVTSDETKDIMTLRLAHHLPEPDGNNQLAVKFAELVSQKSNGEVEIDIYPNGQLGGQKELLEALIIGTVDMSISDTGLLANYEKSIGILDMPYVFKDRDHARKAMSGEVGTALKEKVVATSGIRPLTLEAVAFRNTFLAKKEIYSLEDFKGVKVRTPEAPSIIETFKALGANPTAIPSGEAYTAIQTGVVDGMEGNPEFLTSIKIYEVANNWIETQHTMTCTALNISEKVFQGLPANVQNILVEASEEALDYFYEYTEEVDAKSRDLLKEQGVQFFDMDKAPLEKAVAPMVEAFVKENGITDLYELIKKMGE